MNGTLHERPGVYSSYDASSVISRGTAEKIVGVAAKAVSGTANEAVTVTDYAAGVSVFGTDAAGAPGMSALLRLLFLGGAGKVVAVRVGTDDDGGDDYASAFAALAREENVAVALCDSAALTVQQALRASVTDCAANRRERIAVVGGGAEETAAELVTRAAALNSERVVLVAPGVLDGSGATLPPAFAAAAVAAAIACEKDPAVPLNGAVLRGLTGVSENYGENTIDSLVLGGVTPLESVAGTVSPIRGVTTRTTTAGVADSTWRELTTVLIADSVIPVIRSALRKRFARAKNTAQTRGAIRSQTIVELERKCTAEIIDDFSDVTVTMDDDDPTTCVVAFSFTVAHGLNRIYLTAHIAV